MKKIIGALTITLTILIIDSFGQENIKLVGIAKDGHRNRLLGVNVMIKGTLLGVVTDICGQFSLPIDSDEFTVVFHGMSYDHMRTYEVNLKKGDLKSDPFIFQLGHWKVKNPDCKKVDKRIKRIVIE